jgi:hypothetical protein
MKYLAHSNFDQSRRHLLIVLLACLCLSFNANNGSNATMDAGLPVIHTAIRAQLKSGLTTASVVRSKRPAGTHSRVQRQPDNSPGLPWEGFSASLSVAHHLSVSRNAPLSDSSFCISQIRGRAPPRQA